MNESPFAAPGQVRFLYHATHHKCGTHWLKRILASLAQHYDLRFHNGLPKGQHPVDGIVFDEQSHLDPGEWKYFRGSHMIRDPRDVVASGYFYHLWTTESWAQQPRADLNGMSYQSHLQSISREDGLIAEINTCRHVFQKMSQWNYSNPAVCELKYETLFQSPENEFRRMFRHYGFHPEAVEIAVQIARSLDFQSVAGRTPGVVVERTVTRSGVPGQWQNYFTDKVKTHFQIVAGELLGVLGY
ncbi:MAG: sulfotransferase domain-containing protein [Planctomycetota bacterium]